MSHQKLIFVFVILCSHFAYASDSNSTRQISFDSSLDKVTLHGTLTTPSKIKGAVLMIVGSGKADRDETVRGQLTYTGNTEKLFVPLSDAAISAGYATLRYDKRGVLNENQKVDEKVWKTADRTHLISDAVDAAKMLSQETKIPLKNIVIIGHSEGTIVAVETAIALGSQVKAVLLFGAQARAMKDMLHYQIVESNLKPQATTKERADLEEQFQGALTMIASSKEDFAPDGKPLNWYREFLSAPANKDRALLVKAKFAFFPS